MSVIDLAPRKVSRKRSEVRFRLRNSRSLMTRMVQERIEQIRRPIMTIFTTRSASSNMPIGVSLPACLPPDLHAFGAFRGGADASLLAGASADGGVEAGADGGRRRSRRSGLRVGGSAGHQRQGAQQADEGGSFCFEHLSRVPARSLSH